MSTISPSLSSGAIAGIAVSSSFILFGIVALALFLFRRRRARNQHRRRSSSSNRYSCYSAAEKNNNNNTNSERLYPWPGSSHSHLLGADSDARWYYHRDWSTGVSASSSHERVDGIVVPDQVYLGSGFGAGVGGRVETRTLGTRILASSRAGP
jgi:hypothetical protein